MAGHDALPGVHVRGSLPEHAITITVDDHEYVLDVKTLTSNYRCIYGHGCKGTLPWGGETSRSVTASDPSVMGCCRTGITFDSAADDPELDTPARIAPFVAQLTLEGWQNHEVAQRLGWYTVDRAGRAITRVVGSNCIFLNTEGERPGCALHHLASDLQVSPVLTRPKPCHRAPAFVGRVGEGTSGEHERRVISLSPSWFSWVDPSGYWCTQDPAAFSALEPVYLHMESEFTMVVGAKVYAEMRRVLDQVMEDSGERIRESWGTPVELPMPKWARRDATKRAEHS